MTEKSLRFKEFQGKRFAYLDFGNEYHGRRSFRLWVNRRLITRKDDEDIIIFPVKNARIEQTEKGTRVLRPTGGYTTFDVFVPCGYRGGSSIEILEPNPEAVLDYSVYRSAAGSLGVSHGKVVSVKSDYLIYKWSRSGRLYGDSPTGVTRVTSDGNEEVLDSITDGLEAVKELDEYLE